MNVRFEKHHIGVAGSPSQPEVSVEWKVASVSNQLQVEGWTFNPSSCFSYRWPRSGYPTSWALHCYISNHPWILRLHSDPHDQHHFVRWTQVSMQHEPDSENRNSCALPRPLLWQTQANWLCRIHFYSDREKAPGLVLSGNESCLPVITHAGVRSQAILRSE